MEELRGQSHLGGRKWQQSFEICLACCGILFPRAPSHKRVKREILLKCLLSWTFLHFPNLQQIGQILFLILPLRAPSLRLVLSCSIHEKERSPEKGKRPSVAIPEVHNVRGTGREDYCNAVCYLRKKIFFFLTDSEGEFKAVTLVTQTEFDQSGPHFF